jgi:hypothetical protein
VHQSIASHHRVKNRSAPTPGKKKYPPPRTVTKAGTGCSRCATPFVLHEFELPADIGIQADELQAALGIRTVRLHRCLGIDPVTELAAALKDAVKPTRLYEVRPQIGPLQSERTNEARQLPGAFAPTSPSSAATSLVARHAGQKLGRE